MSSEYGPNRGIHAVIEELKKLGCQFEERLGRGGFGEVYKVRVDNILRAVRISLDPVEDKSAHREQQIIQDLAQLQLITHPRLVSLVSYRIVLGHLVTVWELADEPIRDLARLLESYRNQGQPGIPRDKLIRIIWQLAEAVDFLNERGFYHGDIKPENCLLFHGEVKLADFGLTRFRSVSQTRLSTGAGTVGYAPPETWEGKHHSSCDLYALAVMYAHLATGRHPFGAEQLHTLQVIDRQRQGQCDLAGLAKEEAELVRAVLHADPQKRFNEGARAWVRKLHRALATNRPEEQEEPPAMVAVAERPTIPVPSEPPTLEAAQFEVPGGPSLRASAGAVTGRSLRLRPGASLEEVIARAPEGSWLVLEPGTYRLSKPLRIDKSLTIEGTDRDATIITCDQEGVVLAYVGGGTFRLKHVTVVHLGNLAANVVEIASGTVEIEDCVFRGGVCDEQRKFGGSGLWLHGVARGTVRSCLCTANSLHGIIVSEQAQPVLEGNTCEGNTYNGICYFGSAGGTARNNVCRGNGYHGIQVNAYKGAPATEHAQPMLEGNTCEENTYSGIAYFGSAGGTARNNVCRGNGYHGIEVSEEAQPVLEGNTCEKNTYYGIGYFDSARGTARNNVCRANQSDGIRVGARAEPALQGNSCETNRYHGIAYFGSGGGTARNNVCRGNRYHGIEVSEEAHPELEGNTCEKNSCCGIAYDGSAWGTARNNVCRGNERHGIYVGEQAQPVPIGNNCSNNGGYGIFKAGLAKPTLGQNTLSGNGQGGYGQERSVRSNPSGCLVFLSMIGLGIVIVWRYFS